MDLRRVKKIIIMAISCILIFSGASFGAGKEPELYSPSVILVDAKTGSVLYEKNAHEKLYPASTTKIMTAILTLEYCNLDDMATVSANAIKIVPKGYTHANLVEGEELRVEDLLNVLLIPSANDAANVLAEHVAGSIESFATMMNSKALELGCENTHFTNPSGIHDDNHYSTAYDLSLIGRYAMKNDTFRKIVCKTRYTLPITNKYTQENRTFNTTNDLLKVNHSSKASNYYYEYAYGIKTGYTDKANSCIVAGAKKDNVDVIVVILNGPNTSDGLNGRFLDCKTLFKYAFENYTSEELCLKNQVITNISVNKATKDTKKLNLIAEDSIYAVMKNEVNKEEVPKIIEMNQNVKAPIEKGQVIGKVTYKVNGVDYTSNLLAENDVLVSNFIQYLFMYLFIFVIFLIIFSFLKPKKQVYKRRKRARYTYRR